MGQGQSTQQSEQQRQKRMREQQEREEQTRIKKQEVDMKVGEWRQRTRMMSSSEKTQFYKQEDENLSASSNELLKTTIKDTITRHQQDIKESKTIFDNAMKAGKVKVRNTNVLIVGMAGVGKTATKNLIFGMPQSDVRNSTPLAEAPIQAQVRDVSGTRVQAASAETEWTQVDTNDLEEMVSEAVSVIGHEWAAASTETRTQLREKVETIIKNVASRLRHPFSSRSPEVPPVTLTHDSDVDAVDTSEQSCSLKVPEEGSSISGYIFDLDSELVEMIRKGKERPVDSSVADKEASRKLGSNWIYFIDSGGQPHFHNLLPHFIKGLSIVLFTHRLCDKLDDYPEIHYVVNDQSIGASRSTISVKDTLKYLLYSVCSHSISLNLVAGKPNVLFIGTFHDKIQDSNETLDEKNNQLLHLLPPNYQEELIFHGEKLDQLIFAINAKNPSEIEKDIAKQIRKRIESSKPFEIDVPIKWFVLEVFLNKLSNHLNRKVLSALECFELAHQLLHIDEIEFKTCLKFFHSSHLLHYYPSVLPNIVFTSSQVLLDKLTELVKESYQLRDSKNVSSIRTGIWLEFRDRGIITCRILEKFPKHYVEGLFGPSDLLKLFQALLIITPFTKQDQIDYVRPNVRFFMPSLLDILPASELEKHRFSAEIEPLVLSFPASESLRSGIFCCLQAYLIHSLKWKLTSTDGKPNIISQNCVKLSHPKIPCVVVLIASFLHLEVHVDSKISDYRKVCPLIRDDIIKGIKNASSVLNYTEEEPVLAFFCPHDHEVQALAGQAGMQAWSSAIPKRHLANRLEFGDRLQCSYQETIYPRLTEKHVMWMSPATSNLWMMAGNNTVLNTDMHLRNVRGIVHKARVQWLDIGRGLNVPDDDLDSIHKEHHHDHSECLYRMLRKWMQSGKAQMEDLLDVLEEEIVGHKALVREIRGYSEEQKSKIGLF